MTVTRIKIVSTQGGVTDTYVVESEYDVLAARLAEAERLLGLCLDEVESNADLWTDVSVFLVPEGAADSATPITAVSPSGSSARER
jgi:hypothetical protein